jgi:hypothetical protein
MFLDRCRRPIGRPRVVNFEALHNLNHPGFSVLIKAALKGPARHRHHLSQGSRERPDGLFVALAAARGEGPRRATSMVGVEPRNPGGRRRDPIGESWLRRATSVEEVKPRNRVGLHRDQGREHGARRRRAGRCASNGTAPRSAFRRRVRWLCAQCLILRNATLDPDVDVTGAVYRESVPAQQTGLPARWQRRR